MSSKVLLDRIADSITKRDVKRRDAYVALVRSVAKGDKPTVDDVESTLAAASKTLADLSADVELLERRIVLAGQLVAAEGLDAEERDIRAKADVAAAALEAAEKLYSEAVDPLDHRLAQIRQLRERAESARLELQRSCRDEDVLAEIQAVRVELRSKREERFRLHGERGEKREALRNVQEALEGYKPIHEADRKLWQAEQEALEAELARLAKAETALDQEVARLETAETKAAEKLLEP